MTTEATEKEENYTFEQLDAVLAQLSVDQMRFVVARQEYATDKEAAAAVGISAQTVYRWPPHVKDAVRMLVADGLVMAAHVRRRSLAKAMLVKVDGLDSADERVRQGVSSEIIEWEMGKAPQHIEHSGPGGDPITIQTIEVVKDYGPEADTGPDHD